MAVAPKPKAATVNDTLRDRGIAHAVYLERLKSSEAAAIVSHFRDEVVPDLIEKLTARLARIDARGIDIGPATTKRLEDTLAVMQETVEAWTSGLSADLSERAQAIGVDEVSWQNALIQSVLPITWDTVVPPIGLIRAAVVGSPIDGVLLESIVSKLDAGTKAALERAVRLGISEGESIAKITKRMRDATDLTARTAEAVARTAVGHASNIARTTFYAQNEDLIKGVQWHATLDTRTCASCGMLDGKVYPVDTGARPPRHINCRCTTVPVLKSMKELGLNLPDFDATTRSSMNGQVPASTTFTDWLKRQPASMQDDALGPKRAALYRTGKVDVSDFVNPQGELRSLKDLREREASVFAEAGV